jgi:hypothetical protein
MEHVKTFAIFAFKVAVVIWIINRVPQLKALTA